METQLALRGHGQVHESNHLLLQVIELTELTGTSAASYEALVAPRATPLGSKFEENVVALFAEEHVELRASSDGAFEPLDELLLQHQSGC